MKRFELSPAIEMALARASSLARGAGLASIEPRQLMAALLAEAEGKSVLLLSQFGLAADALQALGGLQGEAPPLDRAPLPLHEASEVVLVRARKLAAQHATEGTVTSDLVLLALLQHLPELRAELESHGLDFSRLQHEIAAEPPPLPIRDELFPAERTEPIDIARILDASANRAREALRVLEDHSRFILGDAFLCAELKELRHELATALAALPADLLLQARDTVHDVGTAISTTAEWDRPDAQAVIAANAKRLQESLRSLEEFGKIVSPPLARHIEQLRYRSYTIERALIIGGRARERLAEAQLYVLVTDALCRASVPGTVREALRGGAQVIQLREKELDDRLLLESAREVRRLTRAVGALFIVNDRPDIALLAEADGVHLGQEDLPVREARRLLGAEALIGVSTHDVAQLRRALLEGASYVGIGPVFRSATKEFGSLAGLDFVQAASAETSLPAFALGGLSLENLGDVIGAGARRVAVSHAVCAADDPCAAAAQFRARLAQVAK